MTEEKELTVTEKAKQLLAKEAQARARACLKIVLATLEEYDCHIEWVEVRRDGKTVMQKLEVVPNK